MSRLGPGREPLAEPSGARTERNGYAQEQASQASQPTVRR